MKNKVIVPPIKSQGIKTKLVPWIKELMPKVEGKWIEPFFGTGVVGFNSGFKEAILGDSNPHIINFYKGVQNKEITAASMREYLEKEGEILRKAGDNGYDHYRYIKKRFNETFSPYDFIFLSRAGFNGMMRFSKKGFWNIPFCKKPDRFAQAYISKICNQIDNVSKVITPDWSFYSQPFLETVSKATKDDIIYCDPPYYGRYVDYYNGWTEADEESLFNALNNSSAKFILSTWHHNDYRKNEMIDKFWNRFNVVTRDHFYHSGGKVENRRTIVEALICNFNIDHIEKHNHVQKEKPTVSQLDIEFA